MAENVDGAGSFSTHAKRVRSGLLVVALIVPFSIVIASTAGTVSAATTTASNAAELRAAISAFNGDVDGEADTIALTNAGPYLLSCGTSEDANVDGDLDYTSSDGLTIEYLGVGRATIAVDQTGGGCSTERVIDVRGGASLQLEQLVITGGDLSSAPSSSFQHDGGGLAARSAGASIVLVDSVVEGNRSGNGNASSLSGGDGGGIFALNSTLLLEGSTVRENFTGNGANREGTAGVGNGGIGGGIYSRFGDVTLIESVVAANETGNGGAGTVDGRPGDGGIAGGLFVGTAALTVEGGVIGGSETDGNSAGSQGERNGWTGTLGGSLAGRGGGAFVTGELTMTGTDVSFNTGGDAPAEPAGDGGDGGRGGGLYVTNVTVLTEVNVHDNRAGNGGSAIAGDGGRGGDGGGIQGTGGSLDVTIVDSIISDNIAGSGGSSQDDIGGGGGASGGLGFGGSMLLIQRTTISGNSSGAGGASTTSFGGTSGSAGGLLVGGFGPTRPTAAIVDSSITGNAVGERGAGATQGQRGTAAGLLASSPSPGSTTITRSTIAENTGALFGGGIEVRGIVAISNSTIASNEAASGGGALFSFSDPATITIEASTIADNQSLLGPSVYFPTPGVSMTISRSFVEGACHDPTDAVIDGGDNVEQFASVPGSCGFGTVVQDAQLAPLQDNGGLTLTRYPLGDSVLVDALAPGDCIESVDQRSLNRPVGTGCDIGAVELDPSIDALNDMASGIADELAVDVLVNDVTTDTAPDPATVGVTADPTSGSTSVDPTTGVITYTPTGSFEGADAFTYTVCGVGLPGVCDSALVSIDITRPDATAEVFTFVDLIDVAALSEQVSNAVTVAGTNIPVQISVTGGEYSVNGGTFTSAAGTVQPGDTVRVRHTASANPLTSVDTTLTVGGAVDTFTSTTEVAAAPAGATRFVPLPPMRLLDTRDGTGAPQGKLDPGETIDVSVTGNLGIPDGAAAVVINLTVAASEGPGFVTAFPRGVDQPGSSTLNVTGVGQVRPNLATVPLGDDGYMSVFTLMGTHLIGDVAGYYEATDVAVAAGRVIPLSPTRLLDTRPSAPGPGPKGFVGADQSISVQVSGEAGVPATGVSAVIMNVTATASAGTNFVTVFPTGTLRPLASSLNLGLGETTANLVMVPLGDDGMVDLYTSGGAHLIADVTGFITDGASMVDTAGLFVPLSPERVFDTRPSQPAGGPKGFVPSGGEISTQVTGVAGVPADAAAVVLNVTATLAPAGFVTAWPSGVDLPNASTLNPQGVSDTRANAAILPVGVSGQIDYFALSGAHLLADTTGYYLS